MTRPANAERSTHHRFLGAIIGYGVSLSSRFPRSDRDVQELLCERGIDVTEEALRAWWHTCGQDDANPLRS